MLKWLRTVTRNLLENPAVPLNSPAALDIFNVQPSSAGVRVTRFNTFGIPAFYRGVDLIASTVGRVDTIVYRHTDRDGKEPDPDHAAYPLLRKRPNSYQTAFTFKQQLISDALWSGNGYAYVRRENGLPAELHLLDPEVTHPVVVRDTKTLEVLQISYVTYTNGIQNVLPFSDVIHVRGLGNPFGLVGMRLLDYAKETLGLGVAVIKYGSSWFENSGNPYLVFEIPGAMPKEKADEFRENINIHHGGLQQSHRPMLLTNGAKLASARINNEEAQWIESRQFSQVDVANLLGLPPHKLGANVSTSYGSLEQENLSMLSDCLDKWFVNCEQEFEIKLLSEWQKNRESHFISFDRDRLRQADTATMQQGIIALVNNRLLSPNEARHKLNLNAIPEEWADEYFGPTTTEMVPDPDEVAAAEAEAVKAQADNSGMAPPAGAGANQDAAEAILTQDDATRLRQLTGTVLERAWRRIRRAAESKPLASFDMSDHRDVILDGLAAFERAAEVVGPVLDDLEAELRAVTAADLDAVFERLDTAKIVDDLCKRS